MKFLVINRPRAELPRGLGADSDAVAGHANAIEAALDDGTLEAAYAFIAGGSAYVINAKDTEDLAKRVRYDPLFRSSNTEIYPIAHAVDFLRAVADEI